ncbi:MAG: hypothetical protein WCH76_05550 [Candidatus Riflemargulisbacteria bacterium]
MNNKIISQSNSSIEKIDLLKLRAFVLSCRNGTCLANSSTVIYILRSLGERAELLGMYRINEDQPFQYLVDSDYGYIDIEMYNDEEDHYDETRLAPEVDYLRVLEELRIRRVLTKIHKKIQQGLFF